MPNTKSAERRMRSNARRHLQNRSIESSLRKLEKSYRGLLASGKKNEAAKSFRDVASAYDKAAKSGVLHRATAARKKSRLAIALNRMK